MTFSDVDLFYFEYNSSFLLSVAMDFAGWRFDIGRPREAQAAPAPLALKLWEGHFKEILVLRVAGRRGLPVKILKSTGKSTRIMPHVSVLRRLINHTVHLDCSLIVVNHQNVFQTEYGTWCHSGKRVFYN